MPVSDRKARSATTDASTTDATVGVQATGWFGLSPPLMKVFIDGRPEGVLQDNTVHEFVVAAGRHEFRIERDWYHSETIGLTLAAGQRVDLVAGCRTWRQLVPYELAATGLLGLFVGVVVLVSSVRRSVLLCSILGGVAALPYLIAFIGTFRPGGFVYLAPLDESQSTPGKGTRSDDAAAAHLD
jgi:hypothetical protein